MDPLSFATTSLDYEGDEAFPACDFADAIVGCVGALSGHAWDAPIVPWDA